MTGRHTGWAGALVGCLALTPPAAGGETREQLLATARDGNRAAIASIRTLQCRYERVPWAGTTPEQANRLIFLTVAPGRFWQSGDAYRLFEPYADDSRTRDYVVRDGQVLVRRLSFAADRPPRPVLGLEQAGPGLGAGGEMWQYLLFSHAGSIPPPGAGFYTLDEILRRPHDLHEVERLPSGEIRLRLSHRGALWQEFWCDPKANHLVRKVVWSPAGDPALRWEYEVIEFAEPAAGVFVPTTVEARCLIAGNREAVIRTVLSDVRVNEPLAADALRLSGIAGMECVDGIRQVRYVVDADGNQEGDEFPPEPLPPPQRSEGSTRSPWEDLAVDAAAAAAATGIALGGIRLWSRRRCRRAP